MVRSEGGRRGSDGVAVALIAGKTPSWVVPAMELNVRACRGPPRTSTPGGSIFLPTKWDESRSGDGPQPSGLPAGFSTTCMTESGAAMFFGRRGGGSEPALGRWGRWLDSGGRGSLRRRSNHHTAPRKARERHLPPTASAAGAATEARRVQGPLRHPDGEEQHVPGASQDRPRTEVWGWTSCLATQGSAWNL